MGTSLCLTSGGGVVLADSVFVFKILELEEAD